MNMTDELLAGPRGRRWCLNAASWADQAVGTAVFWLAHELDPHPGTLTRASSDDTEPPKDPSFTEAEVAAAIAHTDVSALTVPTVREALTSSVELARYWQEPDGTDVVAALPAVRASLARIAERLIKLLPGLSATSRPTQWSAQWCTIAESGPLERDPAGVLQLWTRVQHEDEVRAARDRPSDPHANWSGSWWSVPTQLLETRGTVLAALDCVEDPLGWTVATVVPVTGTGRVLEIRAAEDWAQLCRTYPMEVTASRRHDWFRVTGHDGRWLIPDWERVAQHWDAIHLTALGYLSAATTFIPIDAEYATVIAGWGPDSTLWLTDSAREADNPRQQWQRPDNNAEWTTLEATPDPHLADE